MPADETAVEQAGAVKRKLQTTVLAAAAALLVFAVGAEAVSRAGRKRVAMPDSRQQLAALLPATIRAGAVKDEPMATTEEMKRAVTELLSYDDALFRIYRTPTTTVSLYIARWNAGKLTPRLVAAHTPDVCWPASGWIPEAVSDPEVDSLNEMLAKGGFREGEARIFRANERREHVLFWHIVGNEIVGYDRGAPPAWAWLQELWRYGLTLPPEQLFVRVSSNLPLAEMFRSAEFEPLRAALLDLGLRRQTGIPSRS